MYFYEVWVRSHRYQKNLPLTYCHEQPLPVGKIVVVNLQRETVLGIIYRKVTKPDFTCKPLANVPDLPPLPPKSIELFMWMQAYYPAPIGPLTQLFLPTSLPTIPLSTSQNVKQTRAPITLNAEQTAAVSQIEDHGTYLLHGRTGSGKTRVYAALAAQQLKKGRSVLVLSPEISLTPQLVENLKKLLTPNIIVLHSKLTSKQRSEAWTRILTSEEPLVIVGPRSALFAPVSNIGLVVIDEAHEPAYKQEQQPYYYAPRVAAALAKSHEAILLVGSATPLVTEYYYAQQKKRPIIELSLMATGKQTQVDKVIVDIKDRSNFSQTSAHLSNQLVDALRAALLAGEQSMLYLNRRGTARLCLCQNCGWQSLCPHCDIPLTYHGDTHHLVCHTCGIRQMSLTACPSCASTDIILRAAGTKAITDEVVRLFPSARVQRFDTDNLKSERFEQHFEKVQQGDVDILIGTQLLAKGLDLPKLSTLGIVLADSSLSIPDFTAQERTFQLVQQVMGRVGRGHTKRATAVIQTYNPTNPTLINAIENNWQSFYKSEIDEREKFLFPPFCHLLKLVCRRKTSTSAEKASTELAERLAERFGPSLIIDGPSPAFHEKSGGYYQWQLVLKSRSRNTLIKVLDYVPKSGWAYDIDPSNLL